MTATDDFLTGESPALPSAFFRANAAADARVMELTRLRHNDEQLSKQVHELHGAVAKKDQCLRVLERRIGELHDACAGYQDEAERLRALQVDDRNTARAAIAERDAAGAEVERLREENAGLRCRLDELGEAL